MNYKKPQLVDVTAALKEVKAARYAFKSFGHIKLAAVKSTSHFHWHWQPEICAVLSRYCSDAPISTHQRVDVLGGCACASAAPPTP